MNSGENLTSISDKEFAVLMWENGFEVFVDGEKLPEYVDGGENWEYVKRINNSDSIQAHPADIEKEQAIDSISIQVYDICLKYDNDESLIISYAEEAEPPFNWMSGRNVYENVARSLVEGNSQFVEEFLNCEIDISDERLDHVLDDIKTFNETYDITNGRDDNEKGL